MKEYKKVNISFIYFNDADVLDVSLYEDGVVIPYPGSTEGWYEI